MDAQFWINAWNEGRKNFHQSQFNQKLLQFFPQLEPQEDQRVLVPLCGKSKDLLWLHSLKLKVHGVELYEAAVKAFIEESELSFEHSHDQDYQHYTHQNLTISCGDFFKLNADHSYDLVYDRASLVALPANMRKGYAQVIKRALKKGGRCLLISYEYDQSEMDGPPFSVETAEIQELFGDAFMIQLVESEKPITGGSRLSKLKSELRENVYILNKL